MAAKQKPQEQKHQYYINKIKIKYDDNIIVIGQFVDQTTPPIEHYCIKHNNTFYASPNVMNGKGRKGCLECSNQQRWTYLRLVTALALLIFPDGTPRFLLLISEKDFNKKYKGVHSKCIKLRCTIDEYEWEVSINNLINGGYGQVKIHGRFVDGICYETNTVYQFHGDFWHGNPLRHDLDYINPRNYKRMGDLYEETLIKDQELRDEGYNVIIMWELEWNYFKKNLRLSNKY